MRPATYTEDSTTRLGRFLAGPEVCPTELLPGVHLKHWLANVFCKGPESKCFRLGGSYAVYCNYWTQLCWDRAKALGSMCTNECGSVPVTLYLRKQVVGQIWPKSYSLPTPIQRSLCKLRADSACFMEMDLLCLKTAGPPSSALVPLLFFTL